MEYTMKKRLWHTACIENNCEELCRLFCDVDIDDEHICCAIGDKKHQAGVDKKKEWIKSKLKDGHVFRKLNARGKIFIEYEPIETAWVPINGKNKISMSELKKALEENQYTNVSTYLNSGNVILESNTKNEEDIMKDIYEIVKEKFNLEIPIFVWRIKTASVDIKDKITIRTANTMKKILELCKK